MTNKYEFIRDDINHKYKYHIEELKARKMLISKNKLEPTFKDMIAELDNLGDMPVNQLLTHYKVYTDDHIANYESIQENFEKYVEELNTLIDDMMRDIGKRVRAISIPEQQPNKQAEPAEQEPAQEEEQEEEQPSEEVEEPQSFQFKNEKLTPQQRDFRIKTVYQALPPEHRTFYRIAKETGLARGTVAAYLRKAKLITTGTMRRKGKKKGLENLPVQETSEIQPNNEQKEQT